MMQGERTGMQERDARPRASFQFVTPPEEVDRLHGALLNAQQVELYNGQFIDPFTALAVVAARKQNQLVLQAILEVDEGFSQKYGATLGSPDALRTLLKRYPEGQLSDDGTTFIISRKGQVYGVIQRENDRIIIRRGGSAGQITLSDEQPVNDLKVEYSQFTLLTQRYITSILQDSDADQKQMNIIINLPQLTEGALAAYYSSFEIMAREFEARHRDLDLDTQIGGFEKVKTAVRGLYADITDPDASRKFGNQPFSNRFVLITGAEGTGKSLFPKALDTMLRRKFGKSFEHYRLPFTDIIRKYGTSSATIVKTLLDHVRENEKRGIITVVHLDNLDALCPPDQQAGSAAYIRYMGVVEPVITTLREFGNDLGPISRHIVVFGESRVPKSDLNEGVQRVFRSTYDLRPNPQDLAEALMVQIAQTRKFAEGSGLDPVDAAVDHDPLAIIPNPADGLTGRDVQQAILNITHRNKTSGKNPEDTKITPGDIARELTTIQIEKGLAQGKNYRRVGFDLTLRH